MNVEIVTCTNTVYYTYSYVAIKDQFVTGFVKRGLPYTSDLQTSTIHSFSHLYHDIIHIYLYRTSL